MKDKPNRPNKRRRRRLIIWGSILLVLIIFRLMLPTIVLHYVNKQLAQIPDYTGHVNDIDISLYRGAYKIQGIELNKMTGEVPVPFFSCDQLDLSVQWGALFEGGIVGEIIFQGPKINFVSGPTQEQSQTDIDSSWVDVVKGLMPLQINRLEVQNGEVHYRDYYSSPKVDIFMQNINALALNLSNTADSAKDLPASVDASGNTFGKGAFTFHMDINPLEEPAMFDLNAELKNVDLVQLNDFLRAYGNFDVSQGTFGLYTEIAAKNGKFDGYVKPILKDVKVVQWNKQEGGLLQKAWETVVAGGMKLLENHRKDQVATKVPLSGRMDSPSIDIFTTVGTLLKNAFIQALVPSIDNSVNIGDVGAEDNDQSKLSKELDKEKPAASKEKDEKKKDGKKDRDK
jgi:hypothetical protein